MLSSHDGDFFNGLGGGEEFGAVVIVFSSFWVI